MLLLTEHFLFFFFLLLFFLLISSLFKTIYLQKHECIDINLKLVLLPLTPPENISKFFLYSVWKSYVLHTNRLCLCSVHFGCVL